MNPRKRGESGEPRLEQHHREMFERLRIPEELLSKAGVRSVGHSQAPQVVGDKQFDLTGVAFPYYRPGETRPYSHRIRLDNPHGNTKYIAPPGHRALYFPPDCGPLLDDPAVTVIFVEAEKAALALTALARRADRSWLVVGLGGCWGWRSRDGITTAGDGSRIPMTGPHVDLNFIALQGREVIIAFDCNVATNPSVRNAEKDFMKLLQERGAKVRLARIPAPEGVNGPDDLIAVAGDQAALDAIGRASATNEKPGNPWDAAEAMATFLEGEENEAECLYENILYRETITEMFSPRGLGKSLYATFVAVGLALKGFRVLLLDRDNSRRTVRSRLRAWGANIELKTLKTITREKCPPLTRPDLWASFPYEKYDVVILDSFDALAEGVGEQDSGKPSRAIAPILDIAHRENGPAVLVLGNCVKTGKHSRGSGVVEDRADIVYEVRDATDFCPSGGRPWVEELPHADAGSWATRASRRKRREKYRLAFVPSKFRGDQEPDGFIVEIDLTTSPWSVRDVTAEVDTEGEAERRRQAQERAESVMVAVQALRDEIVRRQQAGEAEILKKQAEEFLTAKGVKQRVAREAIRSSAFEEGKVAGRGHPKALRLAGQNDTSNRNAAIVELSRKQGRNDADSGCLLYMPTTEINPHEAQYPCVSKRGAISVEDPLLAPPENDDGEVVL